MDITYIVMDNEVYGMTKGQASPTTAPEWTQSKLTPHGTGIPRFRPLAIALAAGAGFIARGYSGKPADLSRLLVEAIDYKGFAFVHVLSPCQTFRPEQKAWKTQVHPCEPDSVDLRDVQRCVQMDDGLALGVLYRHPMSVWQLSRQTTGSLSRIEQEFAR